MRGRRGILLRKTVPDFLQLAQPFLILELRGPVMPDEQKVELAGKLDILNSCLKFSWPGYFMKEK
ncbi:MAG TPA: hypothetical protein DET40_15160 [Lentisphaeria bacterium]|nr:MAG: hypothetical protein A2X45_03735 [Lentisphaerae bacterium GWF2_50_93]HCE44878.1 hypothetical protein [Lentisphaeria bacterium]